MPRISTSYDYNSVEWRRAADPTCKEYKIDIEYSLLGYDVANGRLDMLMRYAKDYGHCRRHRHVASTMTLVIEGEQFVTDLYPDGTRKTVHRKKGDYALANPDALPHLEHGGAGGGVVLLSMYAPDGVLFEYFDENMQNGYTLSVQEFVDAWNAGVLHGSKPAAKAGY